MIYIITILIAIILIMSYLLFTKDNNQQQKIDTQGFRNAVKYNLIIKVFLDIFSQSQQLNTKFEKLTGDNESLKQEIHKFEQQIIILHQEYQTILELTNKLQIQNTIFNQRNQDLETNQKSFIQKLGGILYKENLEDKTWDLVLEKTQVLMNERNEALIKIQAFNRENEVLKQENKFLTQEKNNFNQSQEILKSIITTKDGDINSLTQKLMGLEFKVNELQSKPDHNIELQNIQSELNKVQSLIIQKDACIQTLEIEKGENLQKISSLEANVITQKSNFELLTQEKNTLNNHVKQLEGEIQSLNDKIRDFDKVSNNSGYVETLQVQIAQKDHDIHKLEFENNQNIQTIQQLKINLAEKESMLKTTVQDNNDLDIYNRTQQLEQKIRSLTEKLIDVEWELSVSKFQVSNNSSLIEELRKQISQKDASIKKLEYENSENIESLKWLADNLNEKEAQIKLITREKLELDSCVKELEREKTILSQKLIDAELEVRKLNCSLEEIQRQFAQKNAYIQSLEFKNSENLHNISLLEYNLTRQESQLTIIQQENIYLKFHIEQLEQYLEELEQYYLEELEQYPDININSPVEDLEQYLQEIADKDTCIRKLKIPQKSTPFPFRWKHDFLYVLLIQFLPIQDNSNSFLP